MFMGGKKNLECLKSIKMKNCKGHDRLPQWILVDGIDHFFDSAIPINSQLEPDTREMANRKGDPYS